jgi:alpha,alpha-trehalase
MADESGTIGKGKAQYQERLSSERDWSLTYHGYESGEEGLREALCTLGNGYFATRGASPESEPDGIHYPGTYLAGGYNRLVTEMAGRRVENEDLVNLPNWLPLKIRVLNGEWFSPETMEILAYVQELDLKRGTLHRFVSFRDGEGRETDLTECRLVSMHDAHVSALRIGLRPRNWSGRVEILSALDGRVVNAGVARYKRLNSRHLNPIGQGALDGETLHLEAETNQSGIRISQGARTRILVDGERIEAESRMECEAGYAAHRFEVDLEREETVHLEKIACLFTSRDSAVSECSLAARERMENVEGFDALLKKHVLTWERLWRHFGMEIEEDESELGHRTVRILRLHIFHLLQTVSMHSVDLDIGVPARGWHGEAYRGHIFWDELFIFPMLNLRVPAITRALLLYRHRRLEKAKAAARQAGYRGAMFPWQSGSDGGEETQKVHLNPRSGRWLPDNSHLQRHVNIAIAYNVWRYFQTTRDFEFLSYHGAEMVLEIARFWGSAATYNPSLDRYEILGIMGPDEYHDAYPGADRPGLDNNAYTNLMAVWVLAFALDLPGIITESRYRELLEELEIGSDEVERWEEISRKMRVVFHDDCIISQFEGYEDLEEFDWGGYRKKYGDIHRLDRILEAEGDTVNRYKVSKQADVLMLFYLLSAEELQSLFERIGTSFEAGWIPKNIEYYLARTSHGSTLSDIVHSWVLARSDRSRSWEIFCRALLSDIGDSQGGTTPEGIHLGAMAGTVDLIQRGYAGIEKRGNVLWLNPCLPDALHSLRMEIRYRAHSLKLTLDRESVRVEADFSDARPIRIGIGGKIYDIERGVELHVPI